MNTTNCPDLEELKELKSVIEDVLRERSADLEGLFSDDDSCLKNLCSQLFQKKIVTETTKVNPTFHKIMKDFKNCMNYMKNKEKFRMHCISFITSLRSLGGPAVGAAEGLETEWTVAIQKKLKFDLRIEKNQRLKRPILQQRSSLCGIPGGEHVPLHLPPYPPSSSALIRQNLQHNPSFGNTIFTRVKENASHRYTKSLNTLWHDEAERFHNNMEPESIDYDILGYANEPQESKEKSPGVWVRQGGFYWDPEQLKSEQMVYRGENHLSRHAYTDPSFMPNKSDQFVPPSLYDQHLCETASITTSQSESTGQPELTEPTTLSKQVTTATSEDHSEQFLVRSRNGNMSHAPSLLTKLNHMQFELDNLKTTVEQLAHSKINFNEETKNGHDSSCAMAEITDCVDYYEKFMKYYPDLPQMVNFSSRLAESLMHAGFVSQEQVDVIIKESNSTINCASRLLKEVKHMLLIYKEHHQKLREWMIKFCDVLREQNTRTLTELAELLTNK